MSDTNAACLVTGATRGIGAAIARTLEGEGFEVIGLARSRPPDWNGRFVVADLATAEGVTAGAAAVARLGPLWGIVNNAGMGRSGALSDLDLVDMQTVLMVNTLAPALLTKAAVPLMASGGRIVNVCTNGMYGKAERSIYAASKAALASFTKTWALELASHGILVNAVSPGPIDTALFRRRNPAGGASEARVLEGIPVGKIGTVDEVAATVAFLMSADRSYLTGHILTLDGGATAARP